MRKIVLGLMMALAIVICGSTSSSESSKSSDIILLTEDNTVNLRGVVDGASTTRAILALSTLELKRGLKDYPIYLVVNSPGGSVIDGLNFIEYAKTVRNLKTISIFAASMGSAIVEQIPGDRLVTANGIIMFHRAKGAFEGQFNDGEVESQLAFWKSLVSDMEQKNADRMGMSLKEYKDQSHDELWIYGANNVKQKSADKLVALKCSDGLIKATETTSTQVLFFTVDATYSQCPLLQEPIKIDEPQGE